MSCTRLQFVSRFQGMDPLLPCFPGRCPRCYPQVDDDFGFYREAVTQDSPGLPRSGYPGKEFRQISEP